MLGLDTGVLVRYLVRDDQLQFEKARRLIKRESGKSEPVLVSLLVLLETEWVLRSRYELSKAEILSALSSLLDVADLAFEDEPSIEHALYSWRDSAATRQPDTTLETSPFAAMRRISVPSGARDHVP